MGKDMEELTVDVHDGGGEASSASFFVPIPPDLNISAVQEYKYMGIYSY